MKHFRPILSALSRHKSAVAILLAEVALTCAILCNALFLIDRRIDAVSVRSGVDEAHLLHISLSGIGRQDNAMAQTRADLAALRALPGVANASLVSQLPLVNSSWNSGISTKPGAEGQMLNATMYMGEAAMLDTFGLKLTAGRMFAPDEFVDIPDESAFNTHPPKVAIVTRTMAEKLYPGESALGKPFYIGEEATTIIGIVDSLLRPSSTQWSPEQAQYSMLLPMNLPYTLAHRYLIRTRPDANPREVLKAAVAEIKKQNPRRVILDQQTFGEIRKNFFAQDKAMVWLLAIVSIILLAVTAFGIVGLASFWVQQRARQIGVRRALGATRGDILRYFQTENLLLASVGIALGMLLAYGVNQWLMSKYELPRLPLQYLPIGALLLWALGQLAVLWPALRAASIPPATATRSV
ncbi:FtsX-like permease family protein [Lysobacter pythonis]|uniref:FtsX-like permease family protein n=1 Tax=Solilutibacter pythonis TaxID=2483112 RepID=A0A3M2I3P6_9GAMM|nr:FtsX-like permease family protein [Lysobacter pythonis]RMH92844.1 FtsX-like permease family protein [Lysobacter pythonis]